MKIVSLKILRVFWEKYPNAEQHLKAWVDEAALSRCFTNSPKVVLE
jgi:mRNA-degrading endonuclease HigB of HigAB toxin-antitoxin module